MVVETGLFLSMLGLMLIGSRLGVAVGFLLGYNTLEVFLINIVCVFLSIFFVFKFWNNFIEKRWRKIVPENTVSKVRKYGNIGFLVLPALPVALALGQVGAAAVYKSLHRKHDQSAFLALLTGQVLRVLVSIAVVLGIIQLISIL